MRGIATYFGGSVRLYSRGRSRGWRRDIRGLTKALRCVMLGVMDIIAQYRIAQGLTQQQLADRLGVSQPLICLLESGMRRPSPLLAIQIERKTGGVINRQILRPDLFGVAEIVAAEKRSRGGNKGEECN